MKIAYVILVMGIIIAFTVFKYIQSKKESWVIAAICEVVATVLLSLLIGYFQNAEVPADPTIDNEQSTSSAVVENIDMSTHSETSDNTTTENISSIQNTTDNEDLIEEKPTETTSSATTTTNPNEPDIPQEPQPVPIKELILKTSSENYNISQTEFDPRGKMHTNVIRLDSSAVNGIGYRGKLELYTERKYSTFSCSFVPEANYSTNSGAGAYIEIYKDDVLAYTSDLITYKTTAIDVNLDIQNVEYLKIKIINVNKNYPYMANADTLLCNAFVME